MITTDMNYDKSSLKEFIEIHKDNIYLVKLLGQEPYNEEKILGCIKLLGSYGITQEQINITSIGTKVYHKIYEKVGTITLSFSGFNNDYYGFQDKKEYRHENTIGEILSHLYSKVDYMSWIIGKFNIQNLEKDLEKFFNFSLGINRKIPVIGFLLQKGIPYDIEDAKSMKLKTKEITQLFKKYNVTTLSKSIKNEGQDGKSVKMREITYCYDRDPFQAWFRCSLEAKNYSFALQNPLLYIMGQGSESCCTKMCISSFDKGITIEKFDIRKGLYYRLIIAYILTI